jgi:integrase
MYRAGLRVSEALALAAQGRGPRERHRPRPARQGRPVPGRGPRPRRGGRRGGLARRTRQGPTGGGTGQRGASASPAPLLCTAYGTPVTTGYVRRLMKRLGRQAGIAKRVHAHGLRHTHAAQLREEGVDVGIISRQLGHRSLLTTIRYLDHVQPTAVVDAMRGRAWEA